MTGPDLGREVAVLAERARAGEQDLAAGALFTLAGLLYADDQEGLMALKHAAGEILSAGMERAQKELGRRGGF